MTEMVRGSEWAEAWQRLWDRQLEGYAPDREQRIEALLDAVEAVAGSCPLVVDLACGTGTVSLRLLERFPTARSIAVDIDPVLLTIAAETFAGDTRVRIVTSDMRQSGWIEVIPDRPVDAVVSAASLHWFPEHDLRGVYQDIVGLMRPGGVFANADDMPMAEAPTLASRLEEIARRRRDELRADGRPNWTAWWAAVEADPSLADAARKRRELAGGNRSAEFAPPASWHIGALRQAGFAEAGLVWRSGPGGVVAALR